MAIRTLTGSFPLASAPGGGGGGEGDEASFETTNSVVVDGITVNFSADVEVGSYDDPSVNTIWVRPIAPATTVTISSYSPAWGTIAGGTAPGGAPFPSRNSNGAMVNVRAMWGGSGRAAAEQQGFDDLEANDRIHFNAALRAATPITLSPEDACIIAKGNTVNSFLNTYAFVHCVTARPYADEFAPPYCWPSSAGAKPRYRYSDIDEASLPTVSTSGFTYPRRTSAEVIGSRERRRAVDTGMTWARHNLRLDYSGLGMSTYGVQVMDVSNRALALICSDAPVSEKRDAIKYVVQRGIDTYGVFLSAADVGYPTPFPSDGGHQQGRISLMVTAGHLLGVPAMRDRLQNYTLGTNAVAEWGQRMYMSPSLASAASGSDYPYDAAAGEAPVMPEWSGGKSTYTSSQYRDRWNFSYRNTGGADRSSGEAAALLIFGLKGAFNNDAYFDYQARHHALQHYGDDPWRYINGNGTARYSLMPDAPSGVALGNFEREFYDTHIFKSSTYYEFPAAVNDFNGAT